MSFYPLVASIDVELGRVPSTLTCPVSQSSKLAWWYLHYIQKGKKER